MRIEPATIQQLQQSADGRWVHIDADVGSIAQQIQEIAADRGIELSLRVSEVTGVFKVVQTIGDEEQLVTTALDCDQRLVEATRKACSPQYDLAAEIEQLEAEKNREFDRAQEDRIGEAAERLSHALRRDVGA